MKSFTHIFMRNSLFFLLGMIFIFLIPVTSCSYMHNQIPLDIKYFLPEEQTGKPSTKYSFRPWELTSSMFKQTQKGFNPGYYDGELWLEVSFDYPENTDFYKNCILDFGIEPLEYAIIYKETNNKWEQIGITGRNIPSSELSLLSWRQSIPIKLEDFTASSKNILRIKMKSTIGSPIYIKLLQENEWERNTAYNSILNYVLSGFFLICIIFLFSFGSFLKDPLYTRLSFLGFLLFIVLLLLKGTGPVFFWNWLSVLTSQNKQIYIFCLIAVLATFFVFHHINLEIPGRKKMKASMDIINALVGFAIILTILVNNVKINAIIFNIAMLSAFIILVASLTLVTTKKESPLKLLTISWTIAFTFTIFRQGFHFLRTFFPWNLFKFFDTDRYYSYDLIYALIILPALYLSSRRVKKRYELLFEKYKNSNNEVHKLQNEKKFFNQVSRELLDSNTILINSFSLPETSSKEENERTKALIDKTLCHQADFTTALCVINGAIKPNYSPIMLADFLLSTYSITEPQAKVRCCTINLVSEIPENYTVYSEPRILELILGEFIYQCILTSSRNSNITVRASVVDNTLYYSIHSVSPDTLDSENDRAQTLTNENTTYALILKSVEFLGGKITQITGKKDSDFSIHIPFHNTQVNTNNSHTLISSSMHIHRQKILESKKQGAPIIPDNILSVGNKVPTILLVEDDENTCELIKKILDPHSNLITATNGIDAWNYLNLANQKIPDLILCEYELPKMNGHELFSKLKETQTTENIPFIFLLDMNQASEELTLIQKGAVSCFVKPFTSEEIINRILSILTLVSKTQNSVLYHINKAVSAGSSIASNISIERENESSDQAVLNENQTIMLNSSQEAIFKSAGLSKREQQIALLILNGKSDKQIGDDLGISPQTVATHNKNLFKKLNIHSRIELMNKLR